MKTYTYVQIWGNTVLHRGRDENGVRFEEKDVTFKPTLYAGFQKKDTTYHTVAGEPVEVLNPGNIQDCRQFIKQYKDVSGFQLYGNEKFLYQYISEKYPEVIPLQEKLLSVVTIDIECATGSSGFPNSSDAQYEILLISMRCGDTYHTFGTGIFFTDNKNILYTECISEKDLLEKFMQCWADLDPDIITGWNIKLFDIPYLISRIEKVLGDKKSRGLSPWNIIMENEEVINGRLHKTFNISGISILDYLELYKKFTYSNQESYKLNNIAFVELGEKKLDIEEYGSLANLYQQNWQKFVHYNIVDVDLIFKLNVKLNLISLAIELAYLSKINFEDVYSPIRIWDSIIHDRLKKQNVVVPLTTKGEKDHEIMGAFVKEPVPGLFKWVISYDEASLYPNIISSLNLSPDTVVEGEFVATTVDDLLQKKTDLSKWKEKNFVVAANGYCYRRDVRGIIPSLMDEFYTKRSACKKEMIQKQKDFEKTKDGQTKIEASVLDVRQQAYKIASNSCYGILTNPYFRFYDNRIAEAVTTTGQLIIRKMGDAFNLYLNQILSTKNKVYCIYTDTDSVYLCLNNLVEKVFAGKTPTNEEIRSFIDRACKEKLNEFIKQQHEEVCSYLNVYQNNLSMKREVIANKVIFLAKKKYIVNMLDKEGVIYEKPKAKILGIEVVRSSTPEIVRKNLKTAIDIILNREQPELHKFIQTFRQEFFQKGPEAVASPRSCNGLTKYEGEAESLYAKGTPIQVRGSLVYNNFIKKNKLTNKYQLINEGDKIKFVYLKTPNILRENIVAFPDEQLPKEMNLHNKIDYETQFNKTFEEPLKAILATIGWGMEEKFDLESLME